MINEHNLLFYRVNEENKQVILTAIKDDRKSIRNLLEEMLLLS